MQYLPPIDAVKAKLTFSSGKNGVKVSLDYDEFINIIRLYLRGVTVDENWYFNKYPDVKEAVENGTFRSAAHHFLENGYFEGRLPFPLEVNEEWYLREYQDVRAEIKAGNLTSALAHYLDHGYTEGRLPDGFE